MYGSVPFASAPFGATLPLVGLEGKGLSKGTASALGNGQNIITIGVAGTSDGVATTVVQGGLVVFSAKLALRRYSQAYLNETPFTASISLRRYSQIVVATTYEITNYVYKFGAPAVGCEVRLYRRESGQLVATTKTESDGKFSFQYIPYIEEGYFVIAYDAEYPPAKSKAADFITPAAM